MQTITLTLGGMNCGSCVSRVEQLLSSTTGIQQAEVNLAANSARFDFTTTEELRSVSAQLDKAGYPAKREERQLQLKGMNCGSCVRRAEQALMNVAGVLSAEVNLASQQARITLLKGADEQLVLDALANAGYPGQWLDAGKHQDGEQTSELRKERAWLILAVAFALLTAVLGAFLDDPCPLWQSQFYAAALAPAGACLDSAVHLWRTLLQGSLACAA